LAVALDLAVALACFPLHPERSAQRAAEEPVLSIAEGTHHQARIPSPPLPTKLSSFAIGRGSASVLVLAVAVAFLSVIPQGSASSFAVVVAFALAFALAFAVAPIPLSS
jgi:hypothetical protein